MSGALAASLSAQAARPGPAELAALSALVRQCVAEDVPRQALLLRLGPLAGQLRGEHHHRLLREALAPLLRPSRARLFTLPNGDLVALGPENGWHMEEVAARLGTLLADLVPMEEGQEGSAPALPGTLLRLPAQAAALLAALEAALADAPAAAPPSPSQGGAPAAWPALARLAQAIGSADLAAFLRCRPVLRLAPEEEAVAEPQWMEWRIAMPELAQALLGPGAAAPALPPPLRSLVEQRLLAELARPGEAAQRGPVGLSLGLAALDSPAFRRLDAALPPAVRARSVIGIAAAEVLADPSGFLAARQVLAARGWRVALDVPEPGALALLPPDRLGVALVRLRFAPALAEAPLAVPLPAGRTVLTGVDRAAALGWGWEAGITLFEGRLLRG